MKKQLNIAGNNNCHRLIADQFKFDPFRVSFSKLKAAKFPISTEINDRSFPVIAKIIKENGDYSLVKVATKSYLSFDEISHPSDGYFPSFLATAFSNKNNSSPEEDLFVYVKEIVPSEFRGRDRQYQPIPANDSSLKKLNLANSPSGQMDKELVMSRVKPQFSCGSLVCLLDSYNHTLMVDELVFIDSIGTLITNLIKYNTIEISRSIENNAEDYIGQWLYLCTATNSGHGFLLSAAELEIPEKNFSYRENHKTDLSKNQYLNYFYYSAEMRLSNGSIVEEGSRGILVCLTEFNFSSSYDSDFVSEEKLNCSIFLKREMPGVITSFIEAYILDSMTLVPMYRAFVDTSCLISKVSDVTINFTLREKHQQSAILNEFSGDPIWVKSPQ
jgi:hypothetical protein